MADNYAATPGSGLEFASDLISGVHYPRLKLVQGADGSATDVSTSSPLPVGGAAADDAAAAGNPMSIGGVYQASVDEVDSGDVGRVRMSARRALLTAVDTWVMQFTSATPNPSGSDIVNLSGSAPVSSDFAVRNTSAHGLLIPLAAAGWRNCILAVRTADAPFDQPLTFVVTATTAGSDPSAYLASFTVPAIGLNFLLGNGAVGQGGIAGGATAANVAWYNVPALGGGQPYIKVFWSAGVSPTTGSMLVEVVRTT